MDCPTCGFTAADWTAATMASTMRTLTRWYELLAEDASPEMNRTLVPFADRVATVTARPINHDADLADRLHAGLHALHEAGRSRFRAGEGAPPATGQVRQLNASGGGVPKLPVEAVNVTRTGMVGDRQRDREHHGRPWQALCLWSAEVIDALAAEGHPIGYGSAGENVTISGIEWSTLRPGAWLRIGEALLETTPYAVPCRKNAPWFLGGDFGRMAHERQPGVSRIYAQVRSGGPVTVGDPVIVEPGTADNPGVA